MIILIIFTHIQFANEQAGRAKERNKEVEKFKIGEAEEAFQALLVDLCKSVCFSISKLCFTFYYYRLIQHGRSVVIVCVKMNDTRRLIY
jgi:hypothetical protein